MVGTKDQEIRVEKEITTSAPKTRENIVQENRSIQKHNTVDAKPETGREIGSQVPPLGGRDAVSPADNSDPDDSRDKTHAEPEVFGARPRTFDRGFKGNDKGSLLSLWFSISVAVIVILLVSLLV